MAARLPAAKVGGCKALHQQLRCGGPACLPNKEHFYRGPSFFSFCPAWMKSRGRPLYGQERHEIGHLDNAATASRTQAEQGLKAFHQSLQPTGNHGALLPTDDAFAQFRRRLAATDLSGSSASPRDSPSASWKKTQEVEETGDSSRLSSPGSLDDRMATLTTVFTVPAVPAHADPFRKPSKLDFSKRPDLDEWAAQQLEQRLAEDLDAEERRMALLWLAKEDDKHRLAKRKSEREQLWSRCCRTACADQPSGGQFQDETLDGALQQQMYLGTQIMGGGLAAASSDSPKARSVIRARDTQLHEITYGPDAFQRFSVQVRREGQIARNSKRRLARSEMELRLGMPHAVRKWKEEITKSLRDANFPVASVGREGADDHRQVSRMMAELHHFDQNLHQTVVKAQRKELQWVKPDTVRLRSNSVTGIRR